MRTSFQVVTPAGEVVATIAKSENGAHWAEIKQAVAANPGAEVVPVTTVETPCPKHPEFEEGYCPSCGTARVMNWQNQ